ncbi:hypothetical protein NQD34_010059 [Periophthalmus magnuspinnatus]|nr:hypothetical protein NQD34_010059 [Periophthalmus magnuspinnatus]
MFHSVSLSRDDYFMCLVFPCTLMREVFYYCRSLIHTCSGCVGLILLFYVCFVLYILKTEHCIVGLENWPKISSLMNKLTKEARLSNQDRITFCGASCPRTPTSLKEVLCWSSQPRTSHTKMTQSCAGLCPTSTMTGGSKSERLTQQANDSEAQRSHTSGVAAIEDLDEDAAVKALEERNQATLCERAGHSQSHHDTLAKLVWNIWTL